MEDLVCPWTCPTCGLPSLLEDGSCSNDQCEDYEE